MNSRATGVNIRDLALSPQVIYEAMGYGDVTPDSETCRLTEELLREAMAIVHPLFYFKISDCVIGELSLDVDGASFRVGKTISSLLRGAESVAIFVASAGHEFQRWLDRVAMSGDAVRLFVLDAIGSSIVEATGDYMELQLQAQIGEMKHTNRFSPGYCGWSISEQHKLFSLLPPKVCDVELNDSSLMYPIKSISGVIGIGESVLTKRYGCAICSNKNCYLRKR